MLFCFRRKITAARPVGFVVPTAILEMEKEMSQMVIIIIIIIMGLSMLSPRVGGQTQGNLTFSREPESNSPLLAVFSLSGGNQ